MSAKVQFDLKQLIQGIEKELCPKCKAKLRELELPISQTVKIADLIK